MRKPALQGPLCIGCLAGHGCGEAQASSDQGVSPAGLAGQNNLVAAARSKATMIGIGHDLELLNFTIAVIQAQRRTTLQP